MVFAGDLDGGAVRVEPEVGVLILVLVGRGDCDWEMHERGSRCCSCSRLIRGLSMVRLGVSMSLCRSGSCRGICPRPRRSLLEVRRRARAWLRRTVRSPLDLGQPLQACEPAVLYLI